MEYAKITIKPTSPFISQLQSDTIFGHFAWNYRYLYGEDELKKLLDEFENKPFIIFSDGFKKCFLPKALIKPFTDFSCKKADYIKKLKKLSFVPKELIFKNIDSLKDELFLDYVINKKDSCKTNKSEIITQKNSINRLSNRVYEGLYSIKERFIDSKFEIYFAYQTISKEKILEVFDLIAKRGYGKDKSAGKGKFEFEIDWDFSEKKYFTTKRSKYLNLSTMFINKENMHLYYGKTLTKFAKAGGFYAGNEPFKNPFICYTAGSTFIVVGDEVLGRAESKVFNKNKHYQNGFSIGIYFDGE